MRSEFALGDDRRHQLAPALRPGGDDVRARQRVFPPGALSVEALERLVHQAALDERVGDGIEQLRVELMAGEPAIGAEVEFLERGAAVGGDGGKRLQRCRIGQRAGSAGGGLGAPRFADPSDDRRRQLGFDSDPGQQRRRVGPGTVRGERPRQLVRRRRLGQRRDHLRQVPRNRDLLLQRVGRGPVGSGGEQRPHVVDQRRAGRGAAVLVAVAVGEDETAAGQGEAGVEEVALLGLGVAARVEAERLALPVGEEGVGAAVAAGELAVLQRADDDVVEAGGAESVGVGDPDPALDRSRPDAEVELFDQRRQLVRLRGQHPELAQLRQRRGDLRGGAQLQAFALRQRWSVAGVAQGSRGHPSRQRPDLSRQHGRRALRRFAQAQEVARRLAVLALPEQQSGLGVADAAAPQRSLEPVDPPCGDARRTAQVAQEVGSAAGTELRLEQGDQRSADARPRDRHLGLERDRDAVALQRRGDLRPAPGGIAQRDRDLRRVGAPGDES